MAEENKNAFLKPEDIKEESLGSVHYDVWKCEVCLHPWVVMVPAYFSKYLPCPRCKRRAYHKNNFRVEKEHVGYFAGKAVTEFNCEVCNYKNNTVERLNQNSMSNYETFYGDMSSGGSDGDSSFGGGNSGGGGSGSSW